jgi:uncharacterized protein (TIGR02453 family)
MTFRGFPPQTFTFYEGLAADNSRTYWQANKATFDHDVKSPMAALLDELAEFGPFHVFRPHRDVRFSKDKTPYKDHIGAYGESQGGAGFYVQVSHRGMFAGCGYYQMASDQLERFRAAVDADATGAEVAAMCADLARQRFSLGAIAELKTAPRGYAKDHPRIELLRRKGLIATREWPVSKWMHTAAVVGRVREAWETPSPMNAWLDTHVGPSTIPPDDALARFGPM